MAAVFDESGILPTDPGQLLYIPYNGHIVSAAVSHVTTWACHCCFVNPLPCVHNVELHFYCSQAFLI